MAKPKRRKVRRPVGSKSRMLFITALGYRILAAIERGTYKFKRGKWRKVAKGRKRG